MGWVAGQAVHFAIEHSPIVAVQNGGSFRINPRGYLRLPLTVRRSCRITTRDRVLVVADERLGELLVIPLAVIADMIIVSRQSNDRGAVQ